MWIPSALVDRFGLKTKLSRAYGEYYSDVMTFVQPRILGWVSIEVLNGIETVALANRDSPIAAQHRRLIELLADEQLVESQPLRNEFRRIYVLAERRAFPASSTFVAHAQALTTWTRNFSLMMIDPGRLRALDLAAHSDPTFKEYVGKICANLADVAAAPNVKAYSQFFELYSEALALQFLRTKLPTRRIPELETKTPDFECMLDDERKFFVEVKTLDIVGGELRHDQMMVDAIDQSVELKQQISQGKVVAVSDGEFAPYKRYTDGGYDSRSSIRVIDSLREKFVQAFKADQFALGPTIALAVTDRLIIPGGQRAIDPDYLDADTDQAVSGVLWHAAFGTERVYCGPVLRHPADLIQAANFTAAVAF